MNNHHEKWMATIIWVGILLALVFTSFFAWQTTATNTIYNMTSSLWQNLDRDTQQDLELIDWFYLFFNGLIGVLLVLNWFRFGDMSLEMSKAFSKDEAPFDDFLIYPDFYLEDTAEDEVDTDEAYNSVLSALVRNLGFTWVVVILVPPVMVLLEKLLD